CPQPPPPSPGGGGGGGGAPPTLDIERVAPALNLPADTRTANLSVRTGKDASCIYTESEGAAENASAFATTGGRLHHDQVNVTSGTSYSFHVRCRTSGNLSADATIAFSVAQQR
ncbi:MAG: hypothetical protein ABEI97_01360, partial [Candidatus Nanohaloarchaea archaeon]